MHSKSAARHFFVTYVGVALETIEARIRKGRPYDEFSKEHLLQVLVFATKFENETTVEAEQAAAFAGVLIASGPIPEGSMTRFSILTGYEFPSDADLDAQRVEVAA